MTDSRVSWPPRFLLGVCALLVAVGLWLVLGVPEDSLGYEEPVPEDDAAAQCLAGDGTQAPPDGLVQRVRVARDGWWLRLYVSDTAHWAQLCGGREHGFEYGYGTAVEPVPAGGLRFTGGYEAMHKAGVLMGRVPAGATAITAYLPDGGLVQAGTGDGWFVVWAPGVALDGAEVRAVGPDGAVVTSAAAPQEGDPA